MNACQPSPTHPTDKALSDARSDSPTARRQALAEFLLDFTTTLSNLTTLEHLCDFVAAQACTLVRADEGTLHLDTRPLSAQNSPWQITLPLCDQDQELGVLTVSRRPPEKHTHRAFSQQERQHLSLLAKTAAIAIANLKQKQAVHRRTDWRDRALSLLQETGRVMGSTLESVPLMRRIIDVTTRALHAQAGVLALLDDDGNLICRAVAGVASRDLVGISLENESLIGWTSQHGKSARVTDPRADARVSKDPLIVENNGPAHALLAVPLVTKGRIIGAIELRGDHFQKGDQHLLEALGLSAAGAIENARLYERLQRQALQQENIIRVGQAMSSAQDVDAVLQQVVDSALQVIFNAFTATVHLLDPQKEVLRLQCDAGRPLWNRRQQPFHIGQGIAGHVFATRQVMNVTDVRTDPRYVPSFGQAIYRSLLVAPLIVEDRPLGTLSVTGLEPRAFGRDDEQMIRGLAAQAAVALRNARLLDSLRDSEDRYRNLVENANALLIIADAFGQVIFAGGRWAEMTGYEPDEIIGLSFQQLCHPDDLPQLEQYARQLAKNPCKVSEVRYRALHKDGTIHWRETSAVSTAGADGQVKRIYAVVHDVTDHIEAKQAIIRQADQLAALNAIAASISSSLDVDVIVRDGLQKLMTTLNLDTAVLTLLDPDQNRLVPKTAVGAASRFLDSVASLPSPEVVRSRQAMVIPDLLAAPRFARYPGLLEMVRREGLHTLGAAPVVAQNEIIGILFVAAKIRDAISPSARDLLMTVGQQFGVALHNAQLYAQAEERAAQLEVAYRQLQDLAHRKTQFIQNTSHELRTPLTFVVGYLELLVNGELGALSQEQQGLLEIMDRKSQRLLELVNDIGSLVDLELSPDDVEPVDLVDVVARSVTAQRKQAKKMGVVLEAEWPDTPPIVQGSEHRLGQVFHHLLDNAIKFSPGGGRVRVRIWTQGESVLVRVADQGIGIPPSQQKRIFDRFYQVDGSTTRRYSGTGLGLAIVKETVEAHAGTIQLQSSGVPGEGSTFTVILPLIQREKNSKIDARSD